MPSGKNSKISLFIILFALLMVQNESMCEDYTRYNAGYLDSMAVEIEPGENRPFVYSGKGSSFFYGTTNSVADDGHMGYYFGETKLWSDFQIFLDGERLLRSYAQVSFRPHEIVFLWDTGIQLTITPLYDNYNFLLFSISGYLPDNQINFRLQYNDAVKYSENKSYIVHKQNISSPSIFNCLSTIDQNAKIYEENDSVVNISFSGDEAKVVFLHSERIEDLENRIGEITHDINAGIKSREDWLLNEINQSYFYCSDERINKAVNWMKISLASLWAEDGSALWAGFPWFNDCWGRDTFISLPGACLVQGNFAGAGKLFQRFAEWQNRNPDSPDYGRIPNRARAGDIVYNTTDGTPWFVREIYEYGLYSGDRELWKKMLSENGTIYCANEGALKYHTDGNGLMTHGDAETWMDAVGTEGPWSPRGDRAVDIQALWLTQLEASIRMVETVQTVGIPTDVLDKWKMLSAKLRKEIPEKYIRDDKLGLFDHLNINGDPDSKIRPNQLFALTVPLEPIFDEKTELNVIKTVKNYLVYSYGVASLSQTDPDFHPYHKYSLYPKDEAYHMGIVWTWLSGPFKTASKAGWTIAQNEINLTLDKEAPGTMAEVLDAVPQDSKSFPNTSGTVSQAWSLAEFLRTLYQDYIGLKPLYNEKFDNVWLLTPNIPENFGDFTVLLHLRKTPVTLNFKSNSDSVKIRFTVEEKPPAPIAIKLFDDTDGIDLEIADSGEFNLTFDRDEQNIKFHSNSGAASDYQLFLPEENPDQYLKPRIMDGLKVLEPPDHRRLSGKEVKVYNPMSKIICDAADPERDDVGDGDFTYPTDPNFKQGILDLTHFTVRYDDENVYFSLKFRNLVQPGWHPEYGFQLTFATIAINTGEGSTRKNAGRNSGWTLSDGWESNRFIHIGGGLLVEEAESRILAEHIPWKTGYELGDVRKKSISFAVPREFLPGNPDKWKITVLIGAQDDHGGAGIGEFRNVDAKAGRWTGGGCGEGSTNVYDHLQYPEKKEN